MGIKLRPLNLGEVLDRTFQIYRSRFRMFVGIVAFGSALALIWQGAHLFLMRLLAAAHISALTHRIVGDTLAFGGEIFDLAVWAVVISAVYRAVSDMYTSQPTGIARSYIATRPYWFRYIRLSIARFALYLFPLVVPAIPVVVLVVATQRIRHAGEMGGLFALSLTAAVLSVVGLVFSVWLWFRYALVGPACVFENIGIVQAFRRSAILSKGQRRRILAIFLLYCGLFAAFILPFIIHHYHHGRMLVTATIPFLFFQFFVRVLIAPILGIGWMVCYFDARIRREGFDVEWMLQRSAGSETSPELASLVAEPEESGLNPA